MCIGTEYYMVIQKKQSPINVFRLNNASLDKVRKITYLGQSSIDNWDHSQEIRYRESKSGFYENENYILWPSTKHESPNRNDSLLRVHCTIFFFLEERLPSKVSTNRIREFEMCIYRRILKSSRCDHITNISVLERTNGSSENNKNANIWDMSCDILKNMV